TPAWLKCNSNLRQIGQGMMLYANENGGRYPNDFGELLVTQDLTSSSFICGSTNDLPAWGPTTRAAAAALLAGDHCSYIYLGKGFTNAAPAAQIMAYEPLGHHPNGTSFLYGDGRVDFVSP